MTSARRATVERYRANHLGEVRERARLWAATHPEVSKRGGAPTLRKMLSTARDIGLRTQC